VNKTARIDHSATFPKAYTFLQKKMKKSSAFLLKIGYDE